MTIRTVNLNESLRYSPNGNPATFTSYFGKLTPLSFLYAGLRLYADLDRIVYTVPSEYLTLNSTNSSTSGVPTAGSANGGSGTGGGMKSVQSGSAGLVGAAALAAVLLHKLGF